MREVKTPRAFIVRSLLSIFIMIYFGMIIFAILNNEPINNQTNNQKNEQRIEKLE